MPSYPLIDSHIHLDHSRYEEDRDALLDRAWAAGVRGMLAIGIGDGPATMHRAMELARQYGGRSQAPRIWASAGIHPQEAALADATLGGTGLAYSRTGLASGGTGLASGGTGLAFEGTSLSGQDALARLDSLLAEPEVIACGEIGLDYYHDDNPARAAQLRVFAAQMEIAAARKRPLLIHCRPGTAAGADADAWADTLDQIEQQWAPTALGGVLHCFTGEPEHARRALDLGFLISFAGNLTYPSASPLREIARVLPLDRLLVETDGPFLAPVPDRGKRNEPAFVTRTAALLADLHGLDMAELAARTTRNFSEFFHVAEVTADAWQGTNQHLR